MFASIDEPHFFIKLRGGAQRKKKRYKDQTNGGYEIHTSKVIKESQMRLAPKLGAKNVPQNQPIIVGPDRCVGDVASHFLRVPIDALYRVQNEMVGESLAKHYC